jgi:hypothetical protein
VLCLFACLLVRAGPRFVFGLNLIGLGFAGAIVARLILPSFLQVCFCRVFLVLHGIIHPVIATVGTSPGSPKKRRRPSGETRCQPSSAGPGLFPPRRNRSGKPSNTTTTKPGGVPNAGDHVLTTMVDVSNLRSVNTEHNGLLPTKSS